MAHLRMPQATVMGLLWDDNGNPGRPPGLRCRLCERCAASSSSGQCIRKLSNQRLGRHREMITGHSAESHFAFSKVGPAQHWIHGCVAHKRHVRAEQRYWHSAGLWRLIFAQGAKMRLKQGNYLGLTLVYSEHGDGIFPYTKRGSRPAQYYTQGLLEPVSAGCLSDGVAKTAGYVGENPIERWNRGPWRQPPTGLVLIDNCKQSDFVSLR